MPLPSDENDYTVISFDPGGTTGWSVFQIADGVMGPVPFDTWLMEHPVYGHEGVGGGGLEEARQDYKQEQEEAASYRLLDNVNSWSCGQITGERDLQVDEMIAFTRAWPSTAVVVMEHFILRQLRMDSTLLLPRDISERYRQLLRDLGPHKDKWRTAPRSAGYRKRDVVLQPPSLGLGMMDDRRLNAIGHGFFNGTKGKPHARDAVRHALAFLRREKDARAHGRTLHVC